MCRRQHVDGNIWTWSNIYFHQWQSWSSVIYRLKKNNLIGVVKRGRRWNLKLIQTTWHLIYHFTDWQYFFLWYLHTLTGSVCGRELSHWLLLSLPQGKGLLKTILKLVTCFWPKHSTFSLNPAINLAVGAEKKGEKHARAFQKER